MRRPKRGDIYRRKDLQHTCIVISSKFDEKSNTGWVHYIQDDCDDNSISLEKFIENFEFITVTWRIEELADAIKKDFQEPKRSGDVYRGVFWDRMCYFMIISYDDKTKTSMVITDDGRTGTVADESIKLCTFIYHSSLVGDILFDLNHVHS